MTTAPSIDPDALRSMIRDELPSLIAIRHDLHAHPELGYDEHRTSGVVLKELERIGVEAVGGLAGGTGVLGHLPGEADRAVALRADMDALPILEETGLPYASTNEGLMHACGHDGHTTMLLGAARILAIISTKQRLPRPVVFTFQPAEEGGAGGKRMVEDGCLTGTRTGGAPVSRMFGLHGWPQLPLGTVGTRVGPLMAAADEFRLTITGDGCHAAMPHLGHDPVLAGSAFVQAVQQIASRNTDPLDASVVSVTQFHAGTTHNIIPDAAELTGTFRTLEDPTRAMVIQRLHDIAEHVAAAHGCTADLEIIDGYPVTRNHPDAVKQFTAAAVDTLGAERVLDLPHPCMGGEDFSYYCNEVPSCFFFLGLLPDGETSMPSLHQPTFNFNDDALATGIELFCRLALRVDD
jgi:amidohydrolase